MFDERKVAHQTVESANLQPSGCTEKGCGNDTYNLFQEGKCKYHVYKSFEKYLSNSLKERFPTGDHAFMALDVNGDGVVHRKEFGQWLSSLNIVYTDIKLKLLYDFRGKTIASSLYQYNIMGIDRNNFMLIYYASGGVNAEGYDTGIPG